MTDPTFDTHRYVRRRARMTKAQARAYAHLAPCFRASPDEVTGASPLGIEVGFGMGHALLDWAQSAPDWRLAGVELYQPGIGALCEALSGRSLANVRVLEQPAEAVFAALPDASVDEVRIYFPDPWPKKRHHKRRLIQAPFAADLSRTLQPGGLLRLATDWTPYADWMREVLQGEPGLVVQLDQVRGSGEAPSLPRSRTRFETRGERLQHDIHDLIYVRNSATTESR